MKEKLKKNMNTLDEHLSDELNPFNFKEQKIRTLILAGANINAIDDRGTPIAFKALEGISTNGTDLIGNCEIIRCDDTMLIQLLLELGLNVDLADHYDSTILYETYMKILPKTTEVLLKAGASPNIVDAETKGTIYTDVDVYLGLKESTGNYSANEIANLIEIVRLMKHYGGKELEEVYTDKIEKFICITSYFETGLVTWRGMV